jgi:hypothetical protein
MVTRITVPQSIRRVLNYNEQKVKQGMAECLHAGNFLKDTGQMNFHEKLQRFMRNIELNKSKTNTLHISLNFDAADKITSDKMVQVAIEYMQRIGFANQPYLVYRHHDAGHDHCHIVTTNIMDDGKRIDTFNIGKKISEPARKAIEKDFGLTKAEGKGQTQPQKIDVAQKAQYGQAETKRSITNVLNAVINQYKYSSLHELNAVLRLFNVEADAGKEGSRTNNKRGLYYRIIDDQGKKIGVPIKASSIYSRPTLNRLEQIFKVNIILKQANKLSTQTAVDWVLAQRPGSLASFVKKLKEENVNVVLRQSKDGRLYGLTYVDHGTKTVFNGSDLGKRYAAKGILEELQSPAQNPGKATTKEKDVGQKSKRTNTNDKESASQTGRQLKPENVSDNPGASLIREFFTPEDNSEAIARELREDKKKRRRKSINLDEEHEM